MLSLLACIFWSATGNAEVGSYIPHNVTMQDVAGEEIVIHIVGHTHDDPGWLITVDEYYIREVEWIFYTMIPVLKDNPIRKFTYVEMAYMQRWWQEIDDDLKKDTVDLINNGQFQINLGGWCMNDEASPTASAVIHQMTDGNQFVLSNLGLKGRPTVAWHVDPFGHSWVTGGMWAQSGFDAFGVHRINYLDLEKRKEEQNLEFMWKGSASLGAEGYIFLHILDSGYCSPGEINFWNGGSWINTDPLLPSYPPNQVYLGECLVADARTRSAWYSHNQILIPFGCDFAHQNAYQSMIQMDKLIAYINSNDTYNATIIYSTLADYIGAVNDLNLTWPLEQPDFFTYVDSPHAWWSGYFTSRAYLKLYTRSRMNDLRVAEQLYLFARNLNFKADYVAAMFNITFLRDAIDVTQHHDAVTGTEKTAVAEEYMEQLSNGTKRVDHFDESVVGQFLKGSGGQQPVLTRGDDLISRLTNNNFVVMVAYNSLAWNITEILQIPSNRSDLVVYDASKKVIPSQINEVAAEEQNSKYPARYNLFVLAQNMKPLSFETFFIAVATNEHPAVVGQAVDIKSGQTFKAGTGYYSITMDGSTNRLSSITNNNLGKTFAVENQFSQYKPSGGIYNDGYIASGAYIFRPATDNRQRLGTNNNGANNDKRLTVVFRQQLGQNASPGFIVQTHANQRQYLDTFSVIVCGMDLNRSPPTFDYEYYRLGNDKYWGQQPLFDFLVFDNNDASYSQLDGLKNQQTGSVAVTKADSSTKSVTITFAKGFNNIPVLLTSVRNTQCDGSQFVASITSMTANGAVVEIERIDRHAAWNGNIFLDFMVYDTADIVASELLIYGQQSVTLTANKRDVTNLTITLDDKNNNFVVNEPIILVSIQQTAPATPRYHYATTSYMNNNKTFSLNFFPVNPSMASSGNVQLSVKYIAFERMTLFGNVASDSAIANKLITGPLMDEVQQRFRSGYGQTYRLFNIQDPDLRFIDNRVQIGPIDQAAEFVTKYTTELSSNNEYFTNQAGLEYVKRVYYPYWDERIAGNYYPSSGATYIEDLSEDIMFSTIVNQGHGVASLRDGEFEMMLQRRCLQDDSRGVAEVLNATYHTQPQVMIVMDTAENTANLNRRYYQIQQFQHSYFFTTTNSIDEYVAAFNTSWGAMANDVALPGNLFLMQLRYAYSGSKLGANGAMIMQIQNMFETGESSMAVPTNIDLSTLFRPQVLRYLNSTEMNLLASIPLANLEKLAWNIATDEDVVTIRDEKSENKRRRLQKIADRDPNIQLKPRDIKTFVLNVDADVPTQ